MSFRSALMIFAFLILSPAKSNGMLMCGEDLSAGDSNVFLLRQQDLPISAEEWVGLTRAIDKHIRFRKVISDTEIESKMKLGVLASEREGQETRVTRGHEAVIEILHKILHRSEMKALFQRILKTTKPVYIRFSQVNMLDQPGHHLGAHTDSQKDPETKLAGVLYLNDSYAGGELRVFNRTGDIVIKPDAHSMLLFTSDVVHEVLPLNSGRRVSIAFFVGVSDKP